MIKKIYFDMDGVLVNFDEGVINLAKTTPSEQGQRSTKEEDLMWDEIRKVDHFYYKLNPMPNALKMFNDVNKKYKGKVEILTGIPKPRRNISNSAEDKKEWIKKYLGSDIIVHTVYKEDKQNYALGKEYVLIDDYGKNIDEWTSSGGSGIHFKENIDVLKELEKIEDSGGIK